MRLDLVVPPGGSCTEEQLLRSLRPSREEHRAHIDLTESGWCDPAGLVAVAAFAEAQHLAGRWVNLVSPAMGSRSRYLARMRLGQALDAMGCDHNLPPVREKEGLELLEFRRFEGETGAEALAQLVYEKTEKNPAVSAALFRSLCEIGGNVSEHSGRPHGYMAAVSTHDGTRVQFAVADAGSGLTANLARVGSTGDAHSLQMVLEGSGTSSTGDVGRGKGIPDTRELVTSLSGHVSMITRTAARFAYRSTSSQLVGPYGFPGTILQGTLLCP